MGSPSLECALKALAILSSFTTTMASLTGERRGVGGIVPATLPGSWKSLGCYIDVGRTLTGPEYDAANMTIEMCIGNCSTHGFPYAGTEYGSQCFCGDSIATTATQAPADCTMTCAGNHTEACGGPSRLNLFWSGQTGPQTNPGSGLWSFIGCYTEGKTGRILLNGVPTDGGPSLMTVDLCTSACQASGYTLAGTEYSQECWCGNLISNGGELAPEGVAECGMVCNGNGSEFCGGNSRLDIYNFNGTFTAPTAPTATTTTTGPASTASPTIIPTAGAYTYYGCQTEATFARALAAKGTSSPTMTIQSCENFCTGYSYFGTEYGDECYCGNSFSPGSVAAPSTDCNMLCAGNTTEFCGAGNRLSVYQLGGANATTTTTPTAPPVTIPTGWASQGCWVDGKFGRILTNQIPDSSTNTIENCINTCAAGNYTISGTEYSSQCFCDNHIQNGGTLAAPTDCDMPCSGNSSEFCGAGNRITIWSIGTPVVNPPPAPRKRDFIDK